MHQKNKSHSPWKALYVFCLGLFLFSCATPDVQTETLETTIPHVTATAVFPASTLAATESVTHISTATSITSSIPASYDLPNWIHDEKNVLMIVTDISETFNQLSLVNARTDELFAITISPSEIRGYFWTPDGQDFGFLSSDDKTVYLVDTFSGNVEKLSVNEQASILLNKGDSRDKYMLERLGVFGSFSSNDVLFYYCRLCYSFDFTQTIDMEYPKGEYNEPQVSAKNVLTGSKTLLTKPDDQIYDFETVWSPNKFEVAILQGIQPSEPDYMRFGNWPGNRITIYNTKTGQIIDTYQGNFASIRWHWSSDGKKILYRNLPESQNYDGTQVCILYLNEKRSKCIDKLENSGIKSVSYFDWSEDGEKIYYINDVTNPHRSDLCVYDTQAANINCPTKNIPDLDYLNIEGYIASPDGNYFLISYGNSCSTCDFRGEPSIAIVSSEGNGFIFLGKQVFKEIKDEYVYYPEYSHSIWRPIIQP
jgi:hypothetical protein